MARKEDPAFEITFYESVLRRDPRYADVVEILGGLYTKTGRIADGLRMDRKLVRLQPDNATAHYNLGCSLALVKRYSELVIMRRVDGDSAHARGYELDDRELLASMGTASGYLAVLVLALYIAGDTAHALYAQRNLLWLLCPLLIYWISHVWLTAHRGNMNHDPVVFTTSDRTSRILIVLMVATAILALIG